MQNRKKIVLFIVEGINDKTSLALCLDQLLCDNTVLFHITDGDLTTAYGNNESNIAGKIGNMVKQCSGKIFKQSDFQEVIHIIDMDGAFVPDDHINKINQRGTVYTDENILSNDIEKLKNRNDQKRNILNKMTTISKVWGNIPYHIFFFSSNMDHVLHNNPNPNREEKEYLAQSFENQFCNDCEGFLRFFHSEDFIVHGNYAETWKYIKTGTNSLKRHTNFNLYIDSQITSS